MKEREFEPTPFGIYDKNDHWRPSNPVKYSPFFERPFTLKGVFSFFFRWGGYLWPKHVFYGVLAAVSWFYLQPALETTSILSFDWIGLMMLRNIGLIWFFFGGYHLVLYNLKLMGKRQKFHPQWQGKGKRFLFGDQTWDNIIRTTVSGGIIWTAYEVFYFWALANSSMSIIDWNSNSAWFWLSFLLVPLWRKTHFYWTHKIIHWKPIMKRIHFVHHLNYNPGPWSGMSMHTIEHIIYFSVLLPFFFIPLHPIHFFFCSQLTALTPAHGHSGFQGPLFGKLLPSGNYFHYLHHKHVSCNFGGNIIPWDRWFGKFFNGEGAYHTKEEV